MSGKVGGALGAFIIGAGGISAVATGTLLQEGVAINPHLAVVFRGINFREHLLHTSLLQEINQKVIQ